MGKSRKEIDSVRASRAVQYSVRLQAIGQPKGKTTTITILGY